MVLVLVQNLAYSKEPGIVENLIRMAGSEASPDRAEAMLIGLPRLHDAPAEVFRFLEDAAKGPSPWPVRRGAFVALGTSAAAVPPEVFEEAVRVAADRNAPLSVRDSALQLLSIRRALSDSRAAEVARIMRDTGEHPILRSSALSALSRRGGFLEEIRTLAQGDPCPSVRQAATQALQERNPGG